MNAEAPRQQPAPPDLQTQLEDVLHQVWTEERRWRLEERIDRAVRRASDP